MLLLRSALSIGEKDRERDRERERDRPDTTLREDSDSSSVVAKPVRSGSSKPWFGVGRRDVVRV